jgi:outer membrane protein insertion porin family
VNKLNKILVLKTKFRLFIAILFFVSIYNSNAQDRIPYDQGTKYILAKVDVTGKITFNAQTVVTFAGLEKGQNITVP